MAVATVRRRRTRSCMEGICACAVAFFTLSNKCAVDAARGWLQKPSTAPPLAVPGTEAAPGATTGGRISGGGFQRPKVTVDEEIESEDHEIREERHRRGRWTFIDEADPVVSVIKSVKDLFPNFRISCEPTTTLKLRKRIRPLKTVLTLGADYNTNVGVWQFRSSWEDSIIGGRISVAGREFTLTKSWLVKVMDSEDMATRLKFRAAVNTRDWTASAKFGFRTERIAVMNVRDGFSICRKLPLDGTKGHAKLEVVSRLALPEPEVEFKTNGDSSKGVMMGMGDVHISIEELNLVLEY